MHDEMREIILELKAEEAYVEELFKRRISEKIGTAIDTFDYRIKKKVN